MKLSIFFIVLREFNQLTDSLETASSTFKVPTTPQFKYEIKMRYKPSIPDNIKYWKFLKMIVISKNSWK
jgi:hypothetical protein